MNPIDQGDKGYKGEATYDEYWVENLHHGFSHLKLNIHPVHTIVHIIVQIIGGPQNSQQPLSRHPFGFSAA